MWGLCFGKCMYVRSALCSYGFAQSVECATQSRNTVCISGDRHCEV